MQNNSKRRSLITISSLLSLVLAVGLLFSFVYISFDGMISGFSSFGVLTNFREIMGVLALACLLLGLIVLKISISEFKLSKTSANYYKRHKPILICALIVYATILVCSVVCVFETFSDISSVGTAFLSSNIGYFSIGFGSASLIAFLLVIIDLFAFSHDVKNGVISPEKDDILLLNAPKYKLIFSGKEKEIDYTELHQKINRLNELKQKGVLSEEEYKELKTELITHYF
ncbi:MAG: SHOCT domain-containing protein [Clostridia bacterium]|nr:SHOCT domain-containing protein [Clostridia bacterium]